MQIEYILARVLSTYNVHDVRVQVKDLPICVFGVGRLSTCMYVCDDTCMAVPVWRSTLFFSHHDCNTVFLAIPVICHYLPVRHRVLLLLLQAATAETALPGGECMYVPVRMYVCSAVDDPAVLGGAFVPVRCPGRSRGCAQLLNFWSKVTLQI